MKLKYILTRGSEQRTEVDLIPAHSLHTGVETDQVTVPQTASGLIGSQGSNSRHAMSWAFQSFFRLQKSRVQGVKAGMEAPGGRDSSHGVSIRCYKPRWKVERRAAAKAKERLATSSIHTEPFKGQGLRGLPRDVMM